MTKKPLGLKHITLSFFVEQMLGTKYGKFN
jgi:hypothetical protein